MENKFFRLVALCDLCECTQEEIEVQKELCGTNTPQFYMHMLKNFAVKDRPTLSAEAFEDAIGLPDYIEVYENFVLVSNDGMHDTCEIYEILPGVCTHLSNEPDISALKMLDELGTAGVEVYEDTDINTSDFNDMRYTRVANFNDYSMEFASVKDIYNFFIVDKMIWKKNEI